MTNNGNDDLKKQFEAMDQKVTRLRALLPFKFDDADDAITETLANLDDDQLAVMKLISDEIAATVRDMEQLLCGGLLPPRGIE